MIERGMKKDILEDLYMINIFNIYINPNYYKFNYLAISYNN